MTDIAPVQEIIEEFGGQKNIRSEFMQGTVFEIRLPQYLKNQRRLNKVEEKERFKTMGNHRNNKESDHLN
jgi:chemotaxis protein histidine kinase CheA